MDICPVEAALVQWDGQTDRQTDMTKLMGHFRDCANPSSLRKACPSATVYHKADVACSGHEFGPPQYMRSDLHRNYIHELSVPLSVTQII